jgi:hypothetical protein
MTAANHTKTSLGRRTFLATAIAVIGLVGVANAYADPVDLKVVDRETGQPLRIWRHNGRLFVAGQPGARYSLRVTNHTDGRVQVVMSVDGVNIVSGETASYDQTGYILSAHESYDVSGWRKSNTEVAAFTFAPLPQSYAARTGRPGDVGVIGMAVFKERVPAPAPEPEAPPIRGEWREGAGRGSSDAAGASVVQRAMPAPPAALTAAPPPPPSKAAAENQWAGGSLAKRQDEKLGTAHGAREWSVVTMVDFERATPYPQRIRQIEYDTYDNLVASGVIPSSANGEQRPRPFPSNPDGARFVPDPPPEP